MDWLAEFVTVVLGCVMFAGILYIAITGWVEGAFSSAQVSLAAGSLLLFLVVALNIHSLAGVLVIFLLCAAYLAFIITGTFQHHRLAQRLRDEDHASCQRVLARDPKNAAAHEKLARLLEEEGRLHQALASYDDAVMLEPANESLKHRRKHLLERIALTESAQVRCPSCGTVQTDKSGYCWRCGRVFDLQTTVKARLARAGRFGLPVAMVGCAGLVMILIGVIALAVGGMTPASGIATIIVGALAAAGGGVWSWRGYLRVMEEEAMDRDHDDVHTFL